jgi:hypothetical protein
MGKIMIPKAEFLKKEEKKTFNPYTLVSMIAIIVIAVNAISWIGMLGIKKNGGKLPWE